MGQEANITLYNIKKDSNQLLESAKSRFKDISINIEENDDCLKITLMDGSDCIFYLNTEEEEVRKHCIGMANYFSEAPCENKELHNSTLQQISFFNAILGIDFTVDDNDDRTSSIIGRIHDIAKETNSIILYPNMSLYTNEGKLILNIEGETQLEYYNPIASTDLLGTKKVYSKKDVELFEKIKLEIQEKNYPIIKEVMGTQLTIDSIKIVSIENIVKRFLAVFSCSVCAEGVLMDEGSKDIGLAQFISLDQIYNCGAYLSEEEKLFIEGEISEKDAIKFSWRYECAAVLLWSLGLYEIDHELNNVCDVSKMAKILRGFKNFEEICNASKLIDTEKLLEMHTRVLYYHWSCVELKIQKQEVNNINPDVIQEYHYALNWLTQANGTLNWDKISCNT